MAAVFFAVTSTAAPVYNTSVDPMDWTGERTYPGGGLNYGGTGPGTDPFASGARISWSIVFNPVTNLYTYSYTFFTLAEDPPKTLGMSHFILELSPNCYDEQQWGCISQPSSEVEFSKAWMASSSNPGMPDSILGVKFDEESSNYTFVSDRNPVWGNFYAKKSNYGLWNLGLESSYSTSEYTLHFIPRPDTDGQAPQIPEPGTFALIGAGLCAVALIRRRH